MATGLKHFDESKCITFWQNLMVCEAVSVEYLFYSLGVI